MRRAGTLSCVAILCIPLLAAGARAQEEYTVVKGEVDSGGFGGAAARLTEVADDFAAIVGLRGGWVLDHVFVLGGGLYGLVTDVAPESGAEDVKFGYGGIELEYIGDWRQILHWSLYGLIGGGRVDQGSGSDGVFVFEPLLNMEANITTYFHLSLGAGYRVVTGVSGPPLSNRDLSGVVGSITLKFGSF